MYVGEGNVVNASINENNTTTGGQTGDQNQKEIAVKAYTNSKLNPWTKVLRYSD